MCGDCVQCGHRCRCGRLGGQLWYACLVELVVSLSLLLPLEEANGKSGPPGLLVPVRAKEASQRAATDAAENTAENVMDRARKLPPARSDSTATWTSISSVRTSLTTATNMLWKGAASTTNTGTG